MEELSTRKKMNQVTLPIFNEEEIENVFHLYNLQGGKFISRQKAKEALQCIAHSSRDEEIIGENQEIPEYVDIEMFKHLVSNELGVNIYQ